MPSPAATSERSVTGESVRLSEAKRSLLHKYLQGDFRRSPTEKGAIGPRPPGSAIPLSFGQQQLWLHAQLAPGMPVYNEAVTVTGRVRSTCPRLSEASTRSSGAMKHGE